MKKYELTSESMNVFGKTLYRIKALVSFADVNAGDLGGFIEKEQNLSHEGSAWVYGDAQVCGNAWVCGNARVYGDAWVCGDARVCDNAWVYGDARVYGDAQVYGDARACGDANISNPASIRWISNIGSRHDTTTFFRTRDNQIMVTCGCFRGTLDEFLKKVKETHGDNKYAQEYRLAAELAKVGVEL